MLMLTRLQELVPLKTNSMTWNCEPESRYAADTHSNQRLKKVRIMFVYWILLCGSIAHALLFHVAWSLGSFVTLNKKRTIGRAWCTLQTHYLSRNHVWLTKYYISLKCTTQQSLSSLPCLLSSCAFLPLLGLWWSQRSNFLSNLFSVDAQAFS